MIGLDHVHVIVAERRVHAVDEGGAVVVIFQERRIGGVDDRRRRIVNGDLGAHLAAREQAAALFKFRRCAGNFLRDAVRPARRVEERAVRQLVPVGVRAEEPILDHLAAARNGKPRVDIARALGAVTEFRERTAVPADLRLRHPEGLIFDRAQEIITEGNARKFRGRLVVVELRHVELLVHIGIAEKIGRHHIRSETGTDVYLCRISACSLT